MPSPACPAAVLFPEDKSFVAVVFPTADRLKQIQSYAQQAERPLLIVNPQWRNEGQVWAFARPLPTASPQ